MKILCLSLNRGAVKDFAEKHKITNVAFIDDAAMHHDDPYFVEDDRAALAQLGIQAIDINFSDRDETITQLKRCAGIYVTGGNVFVLLQELQKYDMVTIVRDLLLDGKPYIGSSAGAAILAEDLRYVAGLDDPTVASELTDMKGIGVIDFLPLPHFGPETADTYEEIIDSHHETVVVFTDNQALIVHDSQTYTVLESPPIDAIEGH